MKIYLLYDCDDTLVGSERLAFIACCGVVNEVLRRKNAPKQFTPKELQSAFVGRSCRFMLLQLAQQYNFTLEAAELETLVQLEVDQVIAKLAAEVQPAPGVNNVLTQMDSYGYVQGVVSSSALRRVNACLTRAGMSGFFRPEHIFSASDSLVKPTSKPDPAIYLHAAKVLGASPEDCLAIEDSKSGVQSAVGAGMRVYGYVGLLPAEEQETRTRILIENGASLVFDNWANFPSLI